LVLKMKNAWQIISARHSFFIYAYKF